MLYIVRGVSGAGKSTFAATLAAGLNCPHWENDMFLYVDGEYCWSAKEARKARQKCFAAVADALAAGDCVVSNVFAGEGSFKPYISLAKSLGHDYTCSRIENRHGGENGHNVPVSHLKSMAENFQVKLIKEK